MKTIFKIACLFLALLMFLFACEQEPKQLTSDPFVSDIDTLGVSPQALRVVPGTAWILETIDSLNLYEQMILSQNGTTSRESRFTSTTYLEWIFSRASDSLNLVQYLDNDTIYQTLSISNDSLYISDGNGVSLAAYVGGGSVSSVVLTTHEDSINIDGVIGPSIHIPMSDASLMEAWNAAKHDTINKVKNIIVYGDSNTEFIPHAFTVPIRDILAKQFGNAGYGWMNMHTDAQNHVDVVGLGTWYSPTSTAYGLMSLDLFDRAWYADSLDGLTYKFSPATLLEPSAAKPAAQCKQVELHYYGYGSSDIRYSITNPTVATSADTFTTSPGYNVYTVDLPEFGYHDVTFQIITGDSIRCFGFNLTTPDDYGSYGTVVHRIGHSGATASNFWPVPDTLFRQQIENLKADLIIFNLGTNSFGSTSNSKSQLDSLINKVRVWNDSISIALLVPGENTSPSAYELGRAHDRNYWHLSRKYQTGFASLFQLHGDKAISDSLGVYPVGSVHYSDLGGMINADFICSQLLGVYDRGPYLTAGDNVTLTGEGNMYHPYVITVSPSALSGAPVATTSEFSVAANTTLADVPGLTWDVVSGETYEIRAILYTETPTSGGVKTAISGTATATSIVYEALTINVSGSGLVKTRSTALGGSVGGASNVTSATLWITGTITVATSGTITVQFAQNLSNATPSVVSVGSVLQLIQL